MQKQQCNPTTALFIPQIHTNSWKITAKLLRRKSAWQKSNFMLYWLLFSVLNQNLLLPNSKGNSKPSRAWLSSSSTLLIPSVLPAPGAAQLCLWLSRSCLIWNFSSSHRNSGDPPTAPAGGAGEGARGAASARLCDLLGEGEREANRMTLFVCEEEWKHEGCYFRLSMDWNKDTEQRTKNILLNFKLPGTRLGQQTELRSLRFTSVVSTLV